MSTFRGVNGEQIVHRSSRPVEASAKVAKKKSTPGGLAVAWASIIVFFV